MKYTLWNNHHNEVDYHTHYLRQLPLLFVIRALKIYFLNKFQAYNEVLLTTIGTVYVRSLELIHLVSLKLYMPWPTNFHYLLPHSLVTIIVFSDCEFVFLDPSKIEIMCICLSVSYFISIMSYRFIHVVANNRVSFFFKCWIVFHPMYKPHLRNNCEGNWAYLAVRPK